VPDLPLDHGGDERVIGHKVTIRLRYSLGIPWKWVGTCTCGWSCYSWCWTYPESPERGALPMSNRHLQEVYEL
jgi:hypothetical protein